MRQRDRDEVLMDQVPVSVTSDGTAIDLGLFSSHPIGFSLFGKIRQTADDDIFIEFGFEVVDAEEDTITVENHGFITGQTVYFAEGDDSIVGLTDDETYYIIKVDDNTIQLAATKDDAVAGTAVNITDAGEGADHYIGLLGVGESLDAGVKLQVSIDNEFWVDLPSSTQAITEDLDIFWEDVDMMYRYVKPVFTVAVGDLVVDMKFLVVREV
jgi:hypothetical protein